MNLPVFQNTRLTGKIPPLRNETLRLTEKYAAGFLLACGYFISLYLCNWIFFYQIGFKLSLRFWNEFSGVHFFSAFLVFSLTILISARRAFMIFVVGLFSLIMFANTLYYRTYFSLFPFDSVNYIYNTGLLQAIQSSMYLSDFMFFIPVIFLIIVLKGIKKQVIRRSFLPRTIFVLIFSSVMVLLAITCWDPNVFSKMFRQGSHSPYYHDQFYGVRSYGIVPFWIARAMPCRPAEPTGKEKIELSQLLARRGAGPSNLSRSPKNVLIIITESLESWVINSVLDGIEITPNLNSMVNDTGVFFAPRIIPQTALGRSSDAQMILNTGLLPVKNEVTAFGYAHNRYFSLADALKREGYHTAVMNGGARSFWNYFAFSRAQGFETILSREDFGEELETTALGISDSAFLVNCVARIKKLPKPFFCELITLSSHFPFNIREGSRSKQIPSTGEPGYDYLAAVNYTDRAIGLLLNSLRSGGLLDSTMVVITGDHDGLPLKERKRIQASRAHLLNIRYSGDQVFIPFIARNIPAQGHVREEGYQVDIYPTIIEMLGISYPWNGLGYSLLQKPGGKRWGTLSEWIIRNDYFRKPDTLTGSLSDTEQMLVPADENGAGPKRWSAGGTFPQR